MKNPIDDLLAVLDALAEKCNVNYRGPEGNNIVNWKKHPPSRMQKRTFDRIIRTHFGNLPEENRLTFQEKEVLEKAWVTFNNKIGAYINWCETNPDGAGNIGDVAKKEPRVVAEREPTQAEMPNQWRFVVRGVILAVVFVLGGGIWFATQTRSADRIAPLPAILEDPRYFENIEGWVTDISIDATDDTRFATGYSDGTVLLHRLDAVGVPTELSNTTTGGAKAVALEPGGRLGAVGFTNGGIRLFDRVAGDYIDGIEMRVEAGPVYDLAFTQDNTEFISGSHDGVVSWWDIETQNAVAVDGHSGPVLSVHSQPDGTQVLSSGADGRVVLWDALRVPETIYQGNHAVWSARFDQTGTRIAIGTEAGDVLIYDLEAQDVRMLSVAHRERVYTTAFGRDGQVLITGSEDGNLHIYSLPSGRLIGCQGATCPSISSAPQVTQLSMTRGAHDDAVLALGFSFEAFRLISGGKDRRIIARCLIFGDMQCEQTIPAG